MNKMFARVGAILSLAALSATIAVAAPDKGKKAEMPKCPDCKMAMVAHKDKTHAAAVKIKGKTYYCCDKCPMNKPHGTTKKK